MGTDLVEHVKYGVVDSLGWVSNRRSLDRSDAVALAGHSRCGSRSGLWDGSNANADATAHCFRHGCCAGARELGQHLGQSVGPKFLWTGIGVSKFSSRRDTRIEKCLVLDRFTAAIDCLRWVLQSLSQRAMAETMTLGTIRGSAGSIEIKIGWAF